MLAQRGDIVCSILTFLTYEPCIALVVRRHGLGIYVLKGDNQFYVPDNVYVYKGENMLALSGYELAKYAA
jgi:hypothetical protein